jgi:hypothetical protein
MVGRALSRLLPLCQASCVCVEQAARTQLNALGSSILRLEGGVASTATADRQAWMAGCQVHSLSDQTGGVLALSTSLVGLGQAAASRAAVAARQHLQWQSQRGFCEGDLRIV